MLCIHYLDFIMLALKTILALRPVRKLYYRENSFVKLKLNSKDIENNRMRLFMA